MKLTADPRLEDLPRSEQLDRARAVACPFCGRAAGERCLSMNGNRAAVETDYPHRLRLAVAAETYRLTMARRRRDA